MWKEKVKTAKIKETIQAAFNEIYRGNFEEIKELDEEQMYNSWMNSRCETERIKTESHGTSVKKRIIDEKNDDKSISGFKGDDLEEPQMLVSDIYDKNTANKNQIAWDKEETKINVSQPKTDPIVIIGTGSKNPIKSQQGRQKVKIVKPGGEHMDNQKQMYIAHEGEYDISGFRRPDERKLRIHETDDVSDGNSSVEGEILKQPQNQSSSYFKGLTRRQMRSFDRNSHMSGVNNKTFSHTNDDYKALNSKYTTTIREARKQNICLKEQYFTNFNNKIKKDHKLTNSKLDLVDHRLKQSIKHVTRDYNLKMSLNKMHYRNRSANSIKCYSYNEDGASVKQEANDTSKKRIKEGKNDFVLLKTDLYR